MDSSPIINLGNSLLRVHQAKYSKCTGGIVMGLQWDFCKYAVNSYQIHLSHNFSIFSQQFGHIITSTNACTSWAEDTLKIIAINKSFLFREGPIHPTPQYYKVESHKNIAEGSQSCSSLDIGQQAHKGLPKNK